MTSNSTGSGWTETGDGVFCRRYEPVDVTVTAVVGADGAVIVDTRCSLAEGREIKDDVRRITSAPIRWVVNTHAHWDHVWGNAEFDAPRLVPPAEFWGHENIAQYFDQDDPHVVGFKAKLAASSPEWAAKMAELDVRAPDRLVATSHTLDLGDRGVELRHFGRGHTDADLMLWLPDARVLIAGDAVEQSGPPSYGPDSFPLDWAATLDAMLAVIGADATVVPGHGDTVEVGFVRDQRALVQDIAAQVAALHQAGIPGAEAIAANPSLPDMAVARGYEQLSGALA